jgi:hypothetical protein
MNAGILADKQPVKDTAPDMLAPLYLLVVYETGNYNKANFAGLMRQPC